MESPPQLIDFSTLTWKHNPDQQHLDNESIKNPVHATSINLKEFYLKKKRDLSVG